MPTDHQNLYMTADEYKKALARQRERIAKGLRLTMIDDDTTGCKETAASWGLCSDEEEAWPLASDHLWPDQFLKEGRVAPKYRTDGQRCPFDRSRDPKEASYGCFYRCDLFRPKKRAKRPDRAEALRLHDEQIEAATIPPIKAVKETGE
jgi:hypothetical protein